MLFTVRGEGFGANVVGAFVLFSVLGFGGIGRLLCPLGDPVPLVASFLLLHDRTLEVGHRLSELLCRDTIATRIAHLVRITTCLAKDST